MVQITNIVIATAIAAAIPALAAPYGVEIDSREIENVEVEAREPIIGAVGAILRNGGARRMVTTPLRTAVHNAVKSHQVQQNRPSPAIRAAAIKFRAGAAKGKRDIEEFEIEERDFEEIDELDAREPIIGAVGAILRNGGARRMVTTPLRQAVHDAVKQHHVQQNRPSPTTLHAIQKFRAAGAKAHQKRDGDEFELEERDFEDVDELDAREPIIGAVGNILRNGGARRMVTTPLRDAVHRAVKQHQVNQKLPSPATRLALQQFRAAGAKAHQKRDIEEFEVEERDFEDVDELEAREPVLGAMANILANGGARRVVTSPLRNAVSDAVKQHQAQQNKPSPATQLAIQKFRAAGAKAHQKKRDMEDIEDLLERDSEDLDLD